MKKILSLILVLLMNFMTVIPAFAEYDEYADQSQDQYEEQYTGNSSPVLSTGVEEETIYLSPKSTYVLELESDIDINETNKDDEIYFSLASKVKASNGMYLPEHTRFAGRFQKIKKSQPMFKRARAYIIIDKVIFPNDRVYTVRLEPKNGSDLKSSQLKKIQGHTMITDKPTDLNKK